MAKIKLKLNEFDYIEGTPEELAVFIKLFKEPLNIEKSTEIKDTDAEEKKTDVETLDKTKSITEIEERPIVINGGPAPISDLVKEQDVINYIISKKDCEFHSVELQEKFLGKRLRVRDDPVLYGAFDRIIRSARKHIAEKYGGTWDNSETKSLSGRTHVTIYKFRKYPTTVLQQKDVEVPSSTENTTTETPQPEKQDLMKIFA